MCLITNTDVPSIAQEDIHVFKVLRKRWSTESESYEESYVTPHRLTRVDDSGIMNVQIEPLDVERVYEGFKIGGGMIHSYALKDDRDPCYGFSTLTHKMFDAFIPKGTEYFKGESSTGWPSYASKKLVINLLKPKHVST